MSKEKTTKKVTDEHLNLGAWGMETHSTENPQTSPVVMGMSTKAKPTDCDFKELRPAMLNINMASPNSNCSTTTERDYKSTSQNNRKVRLAGKHKEKSGQR